MELVVSCVKVTNISVNIVVGVYLFQTNSEALLPNRRTLGLPSQSFTECHVTMHPSPARLLSPHRKRKGLPGGLLIAKAEKI